MNSRHLNLVLLAVTIGLLGTIVVLVSWLKDGQIPPEPLERTNFIANTVTQITVKKFNATNLLEALASRTLGWRAIESTNYLVYIHNLRSIGCPEETIRDIIIADIAKLFAQRRAAIRAQAPPLEFWRTLKEGEVYGDNPETRSQLKALTDEEHKWVTSLLGADYDSEIAKFNTEDHAGDSIYNFLPPEKRSQVLALVHSYEEMERQIQGRSGGILLASDEQQLRDLEQQKQEALSKILDPEEMLAYDLHLSPLANELRYELNGFSPTAQEFQEIYGLRKTYNQVLDSSFDSNDKTPPYLKEQAFQNAESALDAATQKVLGNERFKEYSRARDADYQALLKLSDRLELPGTVPDQVYNMKLEAERQKQRVEANAQLTAEQRQQALLGIAQETQRSLSQVMGEKVYNEYRKSGGEWVDDLGFSLNESEVLLPEPVP
jgi:hypothetical protein